jgi:hypothetical protein
VLVPKDFTAWSGTALLAWVNPEQQKEGEFLPRIDWVIQGGESKQGKETPRKFRIEWAYMTLAQCRIHQVAFFLKQLGSNSWYNDSEFPLKDSHGGDMLEWPKELRVRECPETYYFSGVA